LEGGSLRGWVGGGQQLRPRGMRQQAATWSA
jgi:hypothetical protein